MANASTLRIIVKGSPMGFRLLQYIDSRIEDINECGSFVVIEKITNDDLDARMVEHLCKRGITNLPALILPNGTIKMGVDNIRELFEHSLRQRNLNQRFPARAPRRAEADDPYQAYQEQHMFEPDEPQRGSKNRYGDFAEETEADLDVRMREYMEKTKKPAPPGRARSSIAAPPTPRRRRAQPVRTHAVEPMDNYEDDLDDNVQQDVDTPQTSNDIRSSIDGAESYDDLDRKMMHAWVNNSPSAIGSDQLI